MKSLVIAKKEIMDLTRDRRTMMMMVVVPFFAMPLMFALVFNLQKNIQEKGKEDESEESLIVKKINEVLDTKIRPAVSRDGGDIKFVSFENGKVTVELRGSCSGCPSSTMTLKNGVQNLLKHYVKDVNEVVAI